MSPYKPVILLSGTPASGKDTITRILTELNPKFRHFKKHRASEQAKTDGTYIHVSASEFADMAAAGEFLQHHYRYERGYGVSKNELNRHWSLGEIPIIHVGKYENIAPLKAEGVVATSILLLVSEEESLRRLKQRHQDEPEEEVERRIAAYRQERNELAALIASGAPLAFDLVLDNSANDARGVSLAIAKFVESD